MSESNPNSPTISKADQLDEKYNKEMERFFEQMIVVFFFLLSLGVTVLCFTTENPLQNGIIWIAFTLPYVGISLMNSFQSKKRITQLELKIEKLENPAIESDE